MGLNEDHQQLPATDDEASSSSSSSSTTTAVVTNVTKSNSNAEDWKSELMFYLNDKRVILNDVTPDTSLLEYLRSPGIVSSSSSLSLINLSIKPRCCSVLIRKFCVEVRKTGTKLACGEGGCGACTVMISHFDAEQQVRRTNHNIFIVEV